MRYGSDLFLAVKFLHVLSAIIGFGAVMLNALYGKKSQADPGPGGLAIFDANFYVAKFSDYFRYLVFVFGLIMVLGKGGPGFGDLWVQAGMGIYLVALGVSHGVMMPTLKKMRAHLGELVAMGPPPEGAAPTGPPPQVAIVEQLGKRVALTGAFLNVAVVAVLYFMIFQPR